jgi:anthranilate 1,2-dioxygenase ferredoxin subunit
MNEKASPKHVIIGQVVAFTTFPHQVVIEGEAYFLTKCDEKYRLLSSICPHAGGQVVIHQAKLVCPLHMWTFESSTGECLIVREAKLAHYEVIEHDDHLIAILP